MMRPKAESTFQAVPVSDEDEATHDESVKRNFYTPPATKPFVLIALLCVILAFIALLQVAISRSVDVHNSITSSARLGKRQAFTTYTEVEPGFQQTITGTTITWPATTATFPSRTITYAVTVQTITGTSESLPGNTETRVAVATVISGTTETLIYELTNVGGTPTSILLPGATPPSAYLNTAKPSVSSATAPSAYLDTSIRHSVVSTVTAGATPPSVYLNPSHPASSSIPTSLPEVDRVVSGDYTTTRYIIATYLGSICVVLLKCIVGHVFASVKMMEPFHQLQRAGGADAKVSLLADYLSSGLSSVSLSTLISRRPVMLLATLSFAVSTILAPFAAESMSIKASQICTADDGSTSPCAPVWILDVLLIRILQALLAFLFCLVAGYSILSYNRPSGIYSDPSSIASVASLLGDREFLEELQSIPPNASPKQIRKRLAGNRYSLGPFQTRSGSHGYGIYKTSPPQFTPPPFSNPSEPTTTPSTTTTKYLQDILLIILSAGLLATILAYTLDWRNDTFNRFFNSTSFGPRFILSSAATLLDNRWKRLEREIRIIQPYRDLSHPSSATLTSHVALSPYTSFPLSLSRGHFFLALVALTTVLADVLIIAVAGVPYGQAEIYAAAQVSTWLSVGILGLMVLVGVAAMVWRRGNHRLPRTPDTVVNIALYVCAGRVVEEGGKNGVRVGSGYWFGWGRGFDGRMRWLVDVGDDGDGER
ncbi:hypothetical protein R6Q59_009923 [Mikania micrantha]